MRQFKIRGQFWLDTENKVLCDSERYKILADRKGKLVDKHAIGNKVSFWDAWDFKNFNIQTIKQTYTTKHKSCNTQLLRTSSSFDLKFILKKRFFLF